MSGCSHTQITKTKFIMVHILTYALSVSLFSPSLFYHVAIVIVGSFVSSKVLFVFFYRIELIAYRYSKSPH